jgi:hypothetical protein
MTILNICEDHILLCINKTEVFLPSDPASQVYILRTRNIWMKREEKNPTMVQPYKMCFKRQNERTLQEQPKAFYKKNSLVE